MSSLVRMISPSAGTPGGRGRACADRDQDVGRGDRCGRLRRAIVQRVRVDERGLAADSVDVVAPELVLDDLRLARDDLVDARQELLGGGALAPDPSSAIRGAAACGEKRHRLAEGLAGDRAGADADPAHAALLLDDRDTLAELGGLHGRALAGGPAADADEIVVVRRSTAVLPSVWSVQPRPIIAPPRHRHVRSSRVSQPSPRRHPVATCRRYRGARDGIDRVTGHQSGPCEQALSGPTRPRRSLRRDRAGAVRRGHRQVRRRQDDPPALPVARHARLARRDPLRPDPTSRGSAARLSAPIGRGSD